MLTLKHALFVCICLLCSRIVVAQNTIDSLRTVLKSAKEDTNKVNILNDLSSELIDIGEFQTALTHASQSKSLAEKLKFKQGIANSCNDIGLIYKNLGNYPEALKNYFAALRIDEEIGNKSGIAAAYNNIGIIYKNLDKYQQALKMHLASLKIKEEIGDKKGIASSYNNIGIIYSIQGNYPEALKNYSASLKIKEETGDKKGIAYSYNNIGNVHLKQKNYPEALKNYFASLKIREESGDKKGIAYSYNNIASAELGLKNPIDAGNYARKALELSKRIGVKEEIKQSYYTLAGADSALGNHKQACENYKLFIIYRDSIINEENTRKNLEASMQYEYEKKATADSLKVAEERRLSGIKFEQEKTQRYYLYAGLALVLVFAGFLFNRFRITSRQKKIISEQKHLVEQKNKEITDSISYAKRLQDAILPPREYIRKYLPESFVLYLPKDIVAGDFYWAEAVEDVFLIAAADSTGHGVPGAMVSVVCSNALNRSVKEFGLREPGKILGKTRELVLETFAKSNSEVKDGMDISLLCINGKNKKISWSGANNPLWYVTKDPSRTSGSGVEYTPVAEAIEATLVELKPNKQAIGKTDDPVPFTTHEIAYEAGTTFYLFTDGYADQFGGPESKKLKQKQLKSFLLSGSGLPLAQQATALSEKFATWKGMLEQIDDVTIIGIRV